MEKTSGKQKRRTNRGGWEGEEGNTPMHRMYIRKYTKVNYYAEHEKEGREREWGWELGEG